MKVRSIHAAALAAALVATAGQAAAQFGTSRERRATPPAEQAAPPAKAPAQADPKRAAPRQSGVVDDNDPIQLSTDVVNVLFSVTDERNRFVGDVGQPEVIVTEDGVTQEVFSFRKETNLPLSIAIAIDVSSSQEHTFADEKRAAAAFLQMVVRPRKDRAAIVTFREDVEWVQGMTSRIERVQDSFNRLEWHSRVSTNSRSGATALYDAVAVTASELFPPSTASDAPTERRTIVLLTDGADTASDRVLQDAVDEALRSDVIVYTIGIGDRYRSTAVKRDVLDLLARQTGGRAYYPESYDDLRTAFQQIEDELRSQYLLAYEPTNVARDGKFREIAITIPGRQDVRVFHRRGYYAPRQGERAPAPARPGDRP